MQRSWTYATSRNPSWSRRSKRTKGRVVLGSDTVEDDSGSYAVFSEPGSSASQMTAAKVRDVVARLPGCAGQAADAVSAYTQVKMEDAPKLLKLPKSECSDIWIRLPRQRWPISVSNIEGPVVPPERNLYDPRRSFITCTWDALNANVSQMKIWLTNTEKCSNRESVHEQLTCYLNQKNWCTRHCVVLRHGRTCEEILRIWQTKQSSNCIRSPHHVLTTMSTKKEELDTVGELTKVCSQIVLKCLYLARMGRLDFLWSVNNLARAVTK